MSCVFQSFLKQKSLFYSISASYRIFSNHRSPVVASFPWPCFKKSSSTSSSNYFSIHWSTYNMACPGNKLRFDLKASELEKEADNLISQTKAVYDAVGSLKPEEVTFENCVQVRCMRYLIAHVCSRNCVF